MAKIWEKYTSCWREIWIQVVVTIRGATGAARAPKPGKTPIMAARRTVGQIPQNVKKPQTWYGLF